MPQPRPWRSPSSDGTDIWGGVRWLFARLGTDRVMPLHSHKQTDRIQARLGVRPRGRRPAAPPRPAHAPAQAGGRPPPAPALPPALATAPTGRPTPRARRAAPRPAGRRLRAPTRGPLFRVWGVGAWVGGGGGRGDGDGGACVFPPEWVVGCLGAAAARVGGALRVLVTIRIRLNDIDDCCRQAGGCRYMMTK